MARGSDRPDIGRGGVLEQLERFPVTCGVLAACVVLFVFALTRGERVQPAVDVGVLVALGGNDVRLAVAQPWRLLTAAFLHADLLHLAFNGLALLFVGRVLEVHFGSARLWVLYVAFALAGSVASAAWQAFAGPAVSVGASGAIYGLVVLGYVHARRSPERLGSLAALLRQWIVYGVVFSVVLAARLDHAAHAGGALAGAAAGALVRPRPGEDVHPAWGHVAHLLGIAALLAFAAVVLTARHSRP